MKLQPAIWTVVLLAGCAFGDDEHWSDSLEPNGPCWDVNLVDGINEQSTTELHNLYACLNRDDNMAALSGLDQALDMPDRSGKPVGLTVAKLSNRLPTSGLDVFGLAGSLLELIRRYADDAELVMQAVVETIYGAPYDEIINATDLGDQASLNQGLVVPSVTLLSRTATTLLDHGVDSQTELLDGLESEILEDTLCTLTGVIRATDSELQNIGNNLISNMGQAWFESSNQINNRWEGPYGNSIRDLVFVAQLDSSNGPIAALREPLSALLSDSRVQLNTVTVLQVAIQNGDFKKIPGQLLHLAEVDIQGEPVAGSRASALQAGARLIHHANRDISCRIDPPLLSPIDIELGNISVEILRRLAEMNETEAVDSVGLLGDVLGSSSVQTLLDFLLVETGVCPELNPLIDDLDVLDRLNDEEVGDLVGIIHGMLDSVYRKDEFNRLPETVDLVSALHTGDLIAPVEELLRDLESTQLMADFTQIVETVIDPSSLPTDACFSDSTPITFNQLWTSLSASMETDGDDGIVSQHLIDTLYDDTVWMLVENTAALSTHPHARIHELPDFIVDVWINENDAINQDAIRNLIADSDIWDSCLMVMEQPDLVSALTLPNTDTEGPLPFFARLITSDTVTVMLQTVDLVLDSLGGEERDSP